MTVSITMISDTHLRHRELDMPEGDILIHCGDMFNLGTADKTAISEIDEWFGRQKFDQILCVGGNHDHLLQHALGYRPQPFQNARYLQDASYSYAGLKIYGSPWVPDLPFHAFHRDRVDLAKAWAKIPGDTDILVTHTPPLGTLDKSSRGHSYGCKTLAKQLKRVSPRVHCFGHVHAGAGTMTTRETLYINASSIESGSNRMLAPITIDLEAA